MNFSKFILIFACLVTLPSCTTDQNHKDTLVSISGATMGTVYRIKIATPKIPQEKLSHLGNTIKESLDVIDSQMNHFDETSQISRFNLSKANEPFTMGHEFSEVLRIAMEISRNTGGALDVTLAPLVRLWGFGTSTSNSHSPPDDTLIQTTLANTGMHHLRFADEHTLFKDIDALELDLSAVAKGYAVDQLAETLQDMGYTHFMIEIGGEIRVSGLNLNQEQWSIGIHEPNQESALANVTHQTLVLTNKSIATSGNYQNYFEYEGERYTHVIDPKTGWPVPQTLMSITVIAQDCATADAAATALMVLGEIQGLRWVESRVDLEALFLAKDPSGSLKETMSSGFEQYLKP